MTGNMTSSVGAAALLFFSLQVTAQTNQYESRLTAEDHFLSRLNAILTDGNRTGIVEYRCRCVDHLMISPPIKIEEGNGKNANTVLKLRQMLSMDPRFPVKVDGNGVIQIAESHLPDGLFSVRIKKIWFTREQQFDPNSAISAVLDSPEVQSFLSKHKMSTAYDNGGLVSMPGDNLPGLEETMSNITVYDAIRLILQKFSHLVVIRTCNDHGNTVISIRFL